MQWIILIGDETLTINSVKNIKHYDSMSSHTVESANGRYWVNFEEDHVYYDFVESLIDEYEKEELAIIPFEKPNFIMMIYRSKERMKQVLKQDNFLRGIYVDDDGGNILPIEDFIKLLDDPNYDVL